MKFGTDIWVFAAVVLRECYYFIPAILQSLLPYANCSRAGGWVCDWALQVVSAWIKDCRRLLQTFFDFHLLIFFSIALSATEWKPGTSFSRAASSGEREGWTGYLGIHSSEHPHVLSNRWGIASVWTGSKQCLQHFCMRLSSFFFSKVDFKKWVFFLFSPWPLTPKFDHVLFAFEKLIYYRSTCFQQPELFPGLSSLWALVIFIHCQIILLGLVNLFVAIEKNIFL